MFSISRPGAPPIASLLLISLVRQFFLQRCFTLMHESGLARAAGGLSLPFSVFTPWLPLGSWRRCWTSLESASRMSDCMAVCGCTLQQTNPS